MQIRIGTRGSRLALWQAEWAKKAVLEAFPDATAELVIIKTKGDRILDSPLARVGGKGLFVKEIEEALLEKKVDIAVHSMKDMPAEIPEGLFISAVPKREIPMDAFLSKYGKPFTSLPKNAKIGTSSLRRQAQALMHRKDLEVVSIRGNVDTRIRKMEDGEVEGILLAGAGLKRLGLLDRAAQIFEPDFFLPAVGQGALCIEARKNDPELEKVNIALDHQKTRKEVLGERAFLHKLGGSCQIPVAGYGIIRGSSYTLTGLVADIEGKRVVQETITGDAEDYQNIGLALADNLLTKGADKILRELVG